MKPSLEKIQEEMKRQYTLYGNQTHKSDFEWLVILGEEFGEICKAIYEHEPTERIHEEIIQTAAVAASWADTLRYREEDAKNAKGVQK